MSDPATPLLRVTAHRPWPLPRRPWVMAQSWRDLLFAHWPVPAAALRPRLPPALTLEEFGGSAWVGLTPFLLADVRPRGLPPAPGLSTFPELNLRTYVRLGERSGIWFFSLDAGSLAAVIGARLAYGLPYRLARMRCERRDGWIVYRSRRLGRAATFVGRYRPRGGPFEAQPGTLEHFLTERYVLYARRGGALLAGEVHHRPWSLRGAEAEIEENTVAAAAGLVLPPGPPLLHFATRQDTLVWPPRRARP